MVIGYKSGQNVISSGGNEQPIQDISAGDYIKTLVLPGLGNEENSWIGWSTDSIESSYQSNVFVGSVYSGNGDSIYYIINDLKVGEDPILVYNNNTSLYEFKVTVNIDPSTYSLVRLVDGLPIIEPIVSFETGTTTDVFYRLNVEQQDYFILDGYIVHNVVACAVFECCANNTIDAYWDSSGSWAGFAATTPDAYYALQTGSQFGCWRCVYYSATCSSPPSYNRFLKSTANIYTNYGLTINCTVCTDDYPTTTTVCNDMSQVIPTPTPTPTRTLTLTPTRTPTRTLTNTPTNTPTLTRTLSNTPTNTPTLTRTLTNTPTKTATPTLTLSSGISTVPIRVQDCCTNSIILDILTDVGSDTPDHYFVIKYNGVNCCFSYYSSGGTGSDGYQQSSGDDPDPCGSCATTQSISCGNYILDLTECCYPFNTQQFEVNTSCDVDISIVNIVKIAGTCYTLDNYQGGTKNPTYFITTDDLYVDCESCVVCPTLTPTPTSTQTETPTPTPTPTPTNTQTETSTPTPTQTLTQTLTQSETATPTPTQTLTQTETATPTPTPTNTQTETATPTQTPTNTQTETATPTPTNTQTETAALTPTPTNTQTETATPTPTQTLTQTETATPTPTPTNTQTETATPTPTPTNTQTETATPTNTTTAGSTNTPTPTQTETATPTPTNTQTETATPTNTTTAGSTNTPTPTQTETATPTPTPTNTQTETATPTPTQTLTQTETATSTPTPTNTQTKTATPTSTPTNTTTPGPTSTSTSTPTYTSTSTLTNTPTPTNTPTETDSPCNGKYMSAVLYDSTPTPTPTNTQTPTFTPTTPLSGSNNVGFIINNDFFVTTQIKRLSDCGSSNYYYVSENLVYNGLLLTAGTIFNAIINGSEVCVTYVDDIDGSASSVLTDIFSTAASCSGCTTTPTPTPSPTYTSTPTLTASNTPTPTPSGPLYRVYSACTGSNTMVVQTDPVSNIIVGQSFSSSGVCWSYVGVFSTYIPPSGFVVINYPGNYFNSVSGPYSNCASCLLPTPTPTPAYRTWNVKWSNTNSCAPCDLTNGGVDITLYSVSSATTLSTGVYVYTDTSLTTPFAPNRYIKTGSQIFETGSNGVINLYCVVGGPC